MPLIIGGAAVAFIFLALLTIVTLYWASTQWRNFTQAIPVVGGALSRTATWLQDRNLELLRDVVGFAHAVINWAIDRVTDGFKLLHDIYNAVTLQALTNVILHVGSIQYWLDTWVNTNIANLLTQTLQIQHWLDGFVNLNINALNFWRSQVQSFLDGWVIPQVNKLIVTTNTITGLTLPTIQARLGVAERTIYQTLPAEIAQNRSDTEAVARVLQQTTTAPGTGLMDRVKGIEGTVAQVLPWALAIGLSLPIARNLARVGRNPCTCLEEDGQTDLMPLVMYLFEEAG